MKKIVLVLLCALMAGTAFAEDYYQDNVGLYFEPTADSNCENRVAVSGGIGMRHVYCVLTELTSTIVRGFELYIAWDGPLMMSNFKYPTGSGAINLLQPPSFLVGFGADQIAVGGEVVVMEFDVLLYSLDETLYDQSLDANLYIHEIFFHSLADPVPAYLSVDDEIKPLHQATGIVTDPVMMFSLDSGGCGALAVPTEETSWDALKSLYR